MPRLLNSSQKRRNMRVRLMSNNGGSLMRRLKRLEHFQKQRINTGRNLSNFNKNWEKYQLEVIRNQFREAGALRALPYGRLKIISKLRNVYPNALLILSARHEAKTSPFRRATVPSLNGVQLAKRTNGRGPNVLVWSPQRSL